ncbi:hypothetical protein P152DRAFT_458701 [Eremomyces bilateralis CBS 781.70]|uniref:Uncharacterized protein n=1 Tax=Eremomyces bilateralis CBS 781.70 TaxID=1392243 RepID=A0A6G1G2V5_9PEZI|nr:uncharacterized protein P152DRAFT_458701 [Eremomyces bilateralis CBS 781.70]KAF1812322.1 hypothetical protein P152DRAFT_458701 [Eremomyces bilateralis CBS 781.70]
MLYIDGPKLKTGREGVEPRWIHIPSNNIEWMKDVFRVLYSAAVTELGSIHGGGKGKGNATDDAQLSKAQKAKQSLEAVLEFIDAEFGKQRRSHWAVRFKSMPQTLDSFTPRNCHRKPLFNPFIQPLLRFHKDFIVMLISV